MSNSDNPKKFIYSFDKNLTILSYFEKNSTKKLFKNILFPLNYAISHNSFSDVFNNKSNRFHKIKPEKLKKKFSNILSKANDNEVCQLAINKQKRLLGIIINRIFYIIGYDSQHKVYS
ncbi:hypothetical protein PA0731 [Candidatus Phytoplasma australiense]|uniref:Uncharacterized protein n=1 Tax=Phytoplasma australiense TaxID=59748 RepID=B1VAU2_PHYAS|nr:hypothetical protein PA0731 [Candidatus Phytoplasma australiense]